MKPKAFPFSFKFLPSGEFAVLQDGNVIKVWTPAGLSGQELAEKVNMEVGFEVLRA